MSFNSEILSNIRFLYSGRDITGDGNELELTDTSNPLEATTFVNLYKTYKPGLADGSWKYNGFSSYGLTAIEQFLAGLRGTTADIPVLFAQRGQAGDKCKFFNASQIDFTPIKGKVGELAAFSLTGGIQQRGHGFVDGYVLEDGFTARTAAGNSAPVTMPAAISGQNIYAIVELLAFTGTSVTFQIRSAATSGGSYTTHFTSAALTAAQTGVYFVPIPGPITDTFYRVDYSGTFTSFQAAVAVGIR